MGQSLGKGPCLTSSQAETIKLSVSAACRRLTAEQVLDLADHLHAIIRNRGACHADAQDRSFGSHDPGAASIGRAIQ